CLDAGCPGRSCDGTKTGTDCECVSDCSCAADTCVNSTCLDTGCIGSNCDGTKITAPCCVSDCSCAADTCVGSTCSDGCGGTCNGIKTGIGCCVSDCSCAVNTCRGSTCPDAGCVGRGCDGTKITAPCCVSDCSCAADTCVGSTCSDGCGGTCAGTKITGSCCVPNCFCVVYTCVGFTCPNGCWGTCAGTKSCVCTPSTTKIKDCSYLNTDCRKYNPKTITCNFLGVWNDLPCDSYYYPPRGNSCEGNPNKACDGGGTDCPKNGCGTCLGWSGTGCGSCPFGMYSLGPIGPNTWYFCATPKDKGGNEIYAALGWRMNGETLPKSTIWDCSMEPLCHKDGACGESYNRDWNIKPYSC
ncbi:MAG: hypothetical protein NTU63_00170, partial [Candidatus Pacearchaeota archaeon]|nr:hypothetical protein [Candidatus Pacearchaeota archaeon]